MWEGRYCMSQSPRPVAHIVTPEPVVEGAGVHLRRSIGTRKLDHLDPFLLLDHFESIDPGDYKAGFRLDPAVRVIWEARLVVPRVDRLEVVEEQEGVEVVELSSPDAAPEVNSRTFDDRFRRHHLGH